MPWTKGLPQFEGQAKVWLMILGGALAKSLWEYSHNGHPIGNWTDLWNALPHVSFEAAQNMFYAFLVRSPFSKTSIAEKSTPPADEQPLPLSILKKDG